MTPSLAALRAGPLPVVVALGLTQTLAWGSTFYLPAILAGPMAGDTGTSTSFVFLAFSCAMGVSALLGPWAGRQIDRHGGRAMLGASNLIFAAGLGLMGLAQGPVLLMAAWLVVGLGMGIGLYEAAFATLARLYGSAARGPITGITLFAGFASTVCWPLTALMEAELGWRMACTLWALAHLLFALPLNRLAVPRAPESGPPAAASPAPRPAQSGRPAQSERLIMVLLAFVFAASWFGSTAMAAHLPMLLREAGASPTAAIAAAAMVGPAQVAGRLLEFGVLSRLHPLLSARMACLGHPFAVVALLAGGATFAPVFAVLHGAGGGIMTIAKGVLPLALFGAGAYGHRLGVLMIPTRITQAVTPVAFALLIDRFGLGALWVSGALSLAAFAALMVLRAARR